MEQLRVAFGDVYMGFHETDYMFKRLFMNRYNAVETDSNPDIIFFNHRKRRHRLFERTNAIRVFITGELQRKNHHPNNFSFSFDDTDDTNFYLPGFVRDKSWFDFIQQTGPNAHQRYPKTKFCHFIYHNSRAEERIECCQALMAYNHVDCPGKVLNNMTEFGSRQARHWRKDKIEFTKSYKFAIAYENESALNYITEKIFHAYYTGSIPIYWGAPNITEFFNPDSFIHARDFANNDELVEYIREVDNNEQLYRQMTNAPKIHETSKLKACTKEHIFEQFDKIVNNVKYK